MQSRIQSVIEACANVAIGYGVAVAAQVALFPMFGIAVPMRTNLSIGAAFTVVSLVRSYAVRRLFNKLHEAQSAVH